MTVPSPLAVAALLPTTLVVVALFAVLWRERTSSRDARVAIASGIVLVVWASLLQLVRSTWGTENDSIGPVA